LQYQNSSVISNPTLIKASDLKSTPDSPLHSHSISYHPTDQPPTEKTKMSADFWAGYVSGAAGIIIGNPLDIVKVNLQRGDRGPPTTPPLLPSPSASTTTTTKPSPTTLSTLLRGTAAPILGYGALNALMFITYNRCMVAFSQDPSSPSSLSKTFVAGALGGLATFLVSAPTELIKCRVQVSGVETSSWAVARGLWRERGLRGLYWGGGVTSLRDSVGYGF
jgi:solute carrier family 25 carnitine/acylcarnitine transporter 20/29